MITFSKVAKAAASEVSRIAHRARYEIQRERQSLLFNLSWLFNRTLTTDILTISLTKKCNLNCSYCWDFNQRAKLEELTTEEIKKLLRSARDLGVRSFNPFGGEPFIRKDAIEIIRYALELGFRTTVTTNGTLVSDDKLRELIESVPPDGTLAVLVSLDGCNADENDYIRSDGSFLKTTNTIRRINELRRELHRPVGLIVNTVVSRNNFRSMKKQVDLSIALGADCVHFITPIVNGGMVGDEMARRKLFIMPSEFVELDAIIDEITTLRDRSPWILNERTSLQQFKGFYRRQYEQHEKTIAEFSTSAKSHVFAEAEMSQRDQGTQY